jgi:hypothetical protein
MHLDVFFSFCSSRLLNDQCVEHVWDPVSVHPDVFFSFFYIQNVEWIKVYSTMFVIPVFIHLDVIFSF